jgi:hypothetical protein
MCALHRSAQPQERQLGALTGKIVQEIKLRVWSAAARR